MALLEFFGQECEHCQKMEPLIERLKKDGYQIETYETWHDAENKLKLWDYDKGFCGGVPFFYNTESNRWICGEADYDDLKAWADGKGGEAAPAAPSAK